MKNMQKQEVIMTFVTSQNFRQHEEIFLQQSTGRHMANF